MRFPNSGIWGLNIHSLRHEGIKPLGVQWIRLDINWDNVETGKRGNYDWSDVDKNINYYLDRGFKVLAILGAGAHPLYENDRKDKDLVTTAIAKYMGATAAHYKGKGILWEILNEPKTFPNGDYWNNPATYAMVARKGAKAIKKADPKAIVAAMSLAWMDRDFASCILKNGLLSDGTIDIISYHGYHRNNILPESGLAEDVTWLRDQIKLYAPKGKKVTVIDSERGYEIDPANSPKDWSFARNITIFESEQAAYLARHMLESISLGIEVAIWYKDMSDSMALYTGDENTPLRLMGHTYRNLALLMPENPLKLKNNRYTISIVDLQDDIPAPDGYIKVRSYLQTRTINGKKSQRLIVALWNPIEAFEGKILESRKRIGKDFYESWRAATPDDKVDIPLQVRVTGPKLPKLLNTWQYDICAQKTDEAMRPLQSEVDDQYIISPKLNVGPVPTVLVFDLAPEK